MESSPEGETKEERDCVEQPAPSSSGTSQGAHNSAVTMTNAPPVSLLELLHHWRVKGQFYTWKDTGVSWGKDKFPLRLHNT